MDEEILRSPSYLGYFDVSHGGFAWREPIPQQIERRRAVLGDALIFDILLSSGGIRDPDTLFPPRDVESLVQLLKVIDESHYDALKKECLVYFLLKWHQDGRETKFLTERCIPPQFGSLADAYWHLDSGIQIPHAVAILSDSRLNGDYASKILHAISISSNPAPLILKYVRTAKPLLTEPDDLDIYTLALAESSLLEAWQFQRTFSETKETRSRLLRKIIDWCISPEPRPRALTSLLGLPLSQFEESLINDYALEPPPTASPPAVAILRDLLCVRLIQAGSYAEAIKVDHRFSSSAFNESKHNSQDRKKMVQDLLAALPLAERSLLSSELNQMKPLKKSPILQNPSRDELSMSQSWEEIERPPTHVQATASNERKNPVVSPLRNIFASKATTAHRPSAPRLSDLGVSAPAAAGPIIPLSSPATNGSISAPRKSFPLLSIPSPSLSFKPRQSLTQGPLFGKTTSGLTHSVSQPASIPPGQQFTSASRKQNAFYQPPPAKVNGTKRTFGEDGQSPTRASDEGMDIDTSHILNSNTMHVAQLDQARGEIEIGAELEFSVFGDAPPVKIQQDENLAADRDTDQNRTDHFERSSRRAPPGAFQNSDEEDGEAEESDLPTSKGPLPERVRSSRSSKPAAPSAKQVTKTKQSKVQDLGRSLPGSLMDDDEEDEDEDDIAPLKAPSPPKRTLRKPRTSATPDPGQDDRGAATRRRSSRLSTTGSVHAASPEPPSPKKGSGTRSRKKAATGNSKRK